MVDLSLRRAFYLEILLRHKPIESNRHPQFIVVVLEDFFAKMPVNRAERRLGLVPQKYKEKARQSPEEIDLRAVVFHNLLMLFRREDNDRHFIKRMQGAPKDNCFI